MAEAISTNAQLLANVEAELNQVKNDAKEWSAKVSKAIEDGDEKKLVLYERQQARADGIVKDLQEQLMCKKKAFVS